MRSAQEWMCFGLPGRTAKATTESATVPPWASVVLQFLDMRPAAAIVSTSRPVDRNAMSQPWPATTARDCDPDGPYDCVNETPLPAAVRLHCATSFSTTGFGVEYATRLSVVCVTCPAPPPPPHPATSGRTTRRNPSRRMRFLI